MKATQYTVRNVPRAVDRALRQKAAERGVSLNTLLLQALESESGIVGTPRTNHDLDSFFGSWIQDSSVDRALNEIREVDLKDWE